MPIAFDRSICCDLNETISREWLITNGLGGYAAGTVAGTLTRMQHGLLVASAREEAAPRLLLAKIDEEVVFDQRTYYLGTNEYRDGTLNPAGFVHLESFRLEEDFPVFTYRLGGIDGLLLEKRIWMPQGLNTTYIQYRVLRTTIPHGQAYRTGSLNSLDRAARNGYAHYQDYPGSEQRMLALTLLPLAAYRPYNEPQYGNNEWNFQVQTQQAEYASNEGEQPQTYATNSIAGCIIRAREGAHPYHIFAVGHPESQTTFIPTGVWYWHFLHRHDQAAGLPATDDLYLPGVFRARLWPGEDSTLTIIVTAEELSTQAFSPGQLTLSYKNELEQQHSVLQPQRYFGEGGESAQTLPVLPVTNSSHDTQADEEFLRLLLQAAERFFAKRTLPLSERAGYQSAFFNDVETTPLLIPGYYNLQDSTRDTLIALPGLTLATRHYAEAHHILRILARYFKQGMLPDQLPAPGRPLEEGDYGSLDTTLWYFYALDHYLRVTRDYELLDELYLRLVDSISWYIQGTFNGIRVDAHDGLLGAHQPGKALTWMNASVKGVPVTPRQGKPVEVNALWYHALSLMHEWSQLLYEMGRINHQTTYYEEQSKQSRHGFNERFWYTAGGYLHDVIDGADGDDPSIRPNQLLALSLRYPVLDEGYHRSMLEVVTQQLVTPFGLRTLAPHQSGYQGHLKENLEEQQSALHQGSAWPWLIGPYIDALLRVEEPSSKASTHPTRDQSSSQARIWRKGLQSLIPFHEGLNHGMLGMIGNAYDGDAPQNPGSLLASATSTGEILRVYKLLAHLGVKYSDQVLIV